jgi:quercetin dioxygenase-like cupin family protein
MPTPMLRLFRDLLAPRQARALPGATRVLYAQVGDVSVSHLGAAVPLTMDHAWHGTGACAVTAGERGATLLRWELAGAEALAEALAEGEPMLAQPMALPEGGAWLIRCDRVDFDPGGVALPHRHRGGGIRCLIAGSLEVTVGDEAPRLVRPGGSWFESGREPVLARASATEPTSFIRVSILPAEIRGQSSIMYVDPADAARGRPRRYTVWVDAPIEVV